MRFQPHKIHDYFLKHVLSHDLVCVASVLRLSLTEEVLACIDLDTLRLVERAAIIDPRTNREYVPDIVCFANFLSYKGGEAGITFFVEGKSSGGIEVGYQGLDYLGEISKDMRKLACFVVVHNGENPRIPEDYVDTVLKKMSRKKKTMSKKTTARVIEACRGICLNFPVLSMALRDIPDKVLLAEESGVVFYVMKHIRRLTREKLRIILEKCYELVRIGKGVVAESIIYYVVNADNGVGWADMAQVDGDCFPNISLEERIMHQFAFGADEIKESATREGLQKGLQKGRQEGQRKLEETALRMLADGATVEYVCRMTGLTRADLARLKKKRA